jgi:hypothetical protein
MASRTLHGPGAHTSPAPEASVPQAQGTDRQPDPGAVIFWLTPAIEADYRARGVFLELIERPSADRRPSGATLRFITPAEAEALLCDSQRRNAARGLARAYTKLIERLTDEIDHAKRRTALMSADKPTKTRSVEGAEHYLGTQSQLQAIGIGVGCQFPSRPYWGVELKDRRGYTTEVMLDDATWGLFTAMVILPEEHRQALKLQKQHRQDREDKIERLKRLPQTPQAFRDRVAESFWNAVDATVERMFPKEGFRFTEDERDEFLKLSRSAYWHLKDAAITGRAPKQIINSLLADTAASDEPFQAFLQVAVGPASEVTR